MWPCWRVGWYDTVLISCLVSNVNANFDYIVQHSLYHGMDIGTMWQCALVSCTLSHSTALLFGCALFWCWVSLGAPFTISLIKFYFIMILIMIVVTIIGILWPFFTFWTTCLGFLWLCSSCSANAQLPGCFRPRTFSLNVGLNMLHSDSFMPCLYSLLIQHSTGEFQALQLIVFAAFGAVD